MVLYDLSLQWILVWVTGTLTSIARSSKDHMYILFSTLGREQLNLDRIILNKVYRAAIGDGSTGYDLLSRMTLEFKLL